MLARGLVEPLKKLGFAATKREGVAGHVFVRKAKGASDAPRQELAFVNIGGSDVDVHLAVRFPKVSALIDPILAHWTPPRGGRITFGRGAAVASGAVYFALDLPEKRPYFRGHDICHQECVGREARPPQGPPDVDRPLRAAARTLRGPRTGLAAPPRRYSMKRAPRKLR